MSGATGAPVAGDAPPDDDGAGPVRRGGRSGLVAALAVLVVAAGLFGVAVWGERLADQGVRLFLRAPPFVGVWRWSWPPAMWWALALAAVLVWWWVPAVEALRWRWVLAGSWAWGLLWPAVLQWSEGWSSLYAVLGSSTNYLPTARAIDSPVEFLATFVDRLPTYATHVKGHPPGATLAFWALHELGGGRREVIAAGVLLLAAVAAPASLVALDRIAGRDAARRAAPFAGLAPAAMWIASSPDALFMGVLALAVACGALAITSGRPAASHGWAAGAGVLAGLSLSLSYGSMLLLGPLWALAVLALRGRNWRPLLTAAAGSLAVALAFVAAGFDWFAGLAATRTAYLDGVAPGRPDRYFVVANLVVFAVAVGPATVAALTWLRDRRAWWLVGGALAGVLAANLSTMSKGEVERIWLPAVPFVVLATCALAPRRARRGWLAAQLAVGLALNATLDSPW